jgi:hypothetical protein
VNSTQWIERAKREAVTNGTRADLVDSYALGWIGSYCEMMEKYLTAEGRETLSGALTIEDGG